MLRAGGLPPFRKTFFDHERGFEGGAGFQHGTGNVKEAIGDRS